MRSCELHFFPYSRACTASRFALALSASTFCEKRLSSISSISSELLTGMINYSRAETSRYFFLGECTSFTDTNIRQVYRDAADILGPGTEVGYVHIFDGCFHIDAADIFENPRCVESSFNITLYTSAEPLNRAKNTPCIEGFNRSRMEVLPE